MARKRTRKWNLKWLRKTGKRVLRLAGRAFPFLIMGGVIWLLGLGVRQMLYADPHFRVERVRIFPTGILTPSEYVWLEKIAQGKSLVDVDLKGISATLSRNPKVRRAEVRRNFPNELNVMILVRDALLQAQFRQGGPCFVIGSDQIAMAKRDEADPDLMVLEDYDSRKKTYSVGEVYENEHFARWPEISNLLMNDSILRKEAVRKVAVDRLGNWSLRLADGLIVKLGKELKVSSRKRAVLKTILQSDERKELLYVDLRYSDVVAQRKR